MKLNSQCEQVHVQVPGHSTACSRLWLHTQASEKEIGAGLKETRGVNQVKLKKKNRSLGQALCLPRTGGIGSAASGKAEKRMHERTPKKQE